MGLLDDLDSIAGSQSQSASNKSISKSPHSNVDSRQGEALAGYNSWSVADLQVSTVILAQDSGIDYRLI